MCPLSKTNRNTTTPAPLTLRTSRACTALLCIIVVSTLNVGHSIRTKTVETKILPLRPLAYCPSCAHKNVTIIIPSHTNDHTDEENGNIITDSSSCRHEPAPSTNMLQTATKGGVRHALAITLDTCRHKTDKGG